MFGSSVLTHFFVVRNICGCHIRCPENESPKTVADFGRTLSNLCRANLEMHPRAIAMLLHVHHATTNEQRQVGHVLKALNIPGAAGSRHGRQLERDGYVTREFYPGDNRSVMYCMTANGQELADRIEAGYQEEAKA